MKSDVDIRPGGAALGVPFDTDSPLFAGTHRSNRVLSAVTRPRKRTDPFFIAALLGAVASLAFMWIPSVNIALAGAALIIALIGYRRYFSYKHRSRYAGLWINYIATVIGIIGLVTGFRVTAFL